MKLIPFILLTLILSACSSKTPKVEAEKREYASNTEEVVLPFEEDEARDNNISKLRKLAKGGASFYFEVQFNYAAETPKYSDIDRLIDDLEGEDNQVTSHYGMRTIGAADVSSASFEFQGSLRGTDLTVEKLVKRLDSIGRWQFIQLEK
jgi:hypothetical protein